MSNPHSFYRFSPAWNTGFYPQNQIASNQLNDIYVSLYYWLPTFPLGNSFSSLKAQVKSIVSNYNIFPVLGNFDVITTISPDPPFVDYYIYIRDNDLEKIDASQNIIITGQYNQATNAVITASISPFTPGSYSGTFDAAHVPAEDNGINALSIVNDYGSAIFPLYYSYDSNLGIASSFLARASSYQLNSGNITRIPADTSPRMNLRRFTLPALSAEDKFAITFMERIMNASIGQVGVTAIQDEYNSMTMPQGWTKYYVFDSSTYDRIQITLDSGGDRVFAMVGRYDGSWLWQRFINDIAVNLNDGIINNYSANTQLPYEPNSGSRYVYLNCYYDFDLCDFTQDCYVSPEFYAMPAIPGDTYQFNVPIDEGNLTGLTSVKVGLFEQDGGFVQNIGSAYKDSDCVNQFYASVSIPAIQTGCYRLGLYSEAYRPCNFTFITSITGESYNTWISQINNAFGTVNPYLSFSIQGLVSPTYYTYTIPNNLQTALSISDWASANIPGMISTWDENGIYFNWKVNELPCGNTYTYTNCISDIGGECIITIWESDPQECICNNMPSLHSLSNIINIDHSDCFSTILEFWSDDNTMAEGFEYFNGWKQRVRIGLNGGGEKPVIEENLYRQSNGVHKRPQNKQDLSLDLHTDFFDLDTQLAMTDATRHPYLVWSGKPIFVKGDIEVATIQDFTTQSSFETLSQMKFQALLQGFQPKNSSCLNC